MKRVRSGITMGVVAFVTAVASYPSAHASQLNLLPMLQLSGQYSDNVFFSQTNKVSDTFFLVNPGIALDYASKKFVGSLAYQAGIQRYVDFSQRDNHVHRADASLGFNLSKDWAIDATDNLYVTTDPLAFDATGDRLQRDSFTYNRFVPGMSYHFGGHNLRLGARYDRIDIDYTTLIDSKQNGFGANASTKLGAKSTLGFDFFAFKREFDQQRPEFNVVDYKGKRYGVTFDRRLSPRIAARLLAGYEDRKFEDNPGLRNFDSFIFDATLTGEFPDVFSWSLGVNQRLNDLAIRGAYVVKRVTFDVRKSVAEKLRLDLSGFWQNSKNDQIPEKADFVGARVEGQYMVAKFLNVWVGYDYLKRSSDDSSLDPFKENRVNFGLSLSYGL